MAQTLLGRRHQGIAQKQASFRSSVAIPPWAVAVLQRRLEEPQGFDGYQATYDWLESQLGIAAEYKT
ncbi:MAG TPA: hypothetical protein V6C50_13480, partial [Crinalium sp.]